MFGMLDYRAHKLYVILFGIPNKIINLFSVFGMPFICYGTGLYFSDDRFFQVIISQVIISIVSLLIFEIIWALILMLVILKIFQFIFTLIVDVIPHDGRTKEEAQMVVWNGEKAIRMFELANHPRTWTDEYIYDVPKNDWVQNLFFREAVVNRLKSIRDHWFEGDDTEVSPYMIKEHLEKNNLTQPWQEKIFTEKTYRALIIRYSIFIILLILNPFA
jgi:hypothetical protein